MTHIPSGEDKISKPASVTLPVLQNRLSKSRTYTILDVGCGNGRDIAYFTSQLDNLITYGIDISQNAIEDAIRLNSNNPHATFECKNWKDLDDTQYDIIYISGVYHFFNLSERETFVEKVKGILKPRGLFFLSTLSSNDTQYYGKGTPVKNDPHSFQTSEYFLHFCSEDELREDFKFLYILNLFEFFHKNYARDTEFHTMWMLIGEKKYVYS